MILLIWPQTFQQMDTHKTVHLLLSKPSFVIIPWNNWPTMRIQPDYPPITCIYSIGSRYHYLGATRGPNYTHTSTNRHKPKYNKIYLTVAYKGHCFIKMYFPFRFELKPSKPIHPLCQTHPRTILLTMHFYNVFMSHFDLNQWSKTFETIHQSHQDSHTGSRSNTLYVCYL